MPSTLPPTFASAAASRDDPSSPRTPRADGYGEWSRRPNGATQTFRRTSTATSLTQSQQQREQPTGNASSGTGSSTTYVPPQVSASRNGHVLETRYSRNQLLELFRDQKLAGALDVGLQELYVGEIDLSQSNGANAGRWGRREDNKHEVQLGTEACWDRGGSMEPVGLVELTEEENELFTSSVNSTIKASGAAGREGTQREGGMSRKLSMSHGQNSNALASPSTARSTNRRRETSESYPFPISTTNVSRAPRDEPASAHPALGLLRRKTELLDSEPDNAIEEQESDSAFGSAIGSGSPYGTVRRRPAGPMSAGLTGPSSPWGSNPSASSFGAMGSFGTFAAVPNSASATGQRESRFRGLMSKTGSEVQSSSAAFGGQGLSDQAHVREPSEEAEEEILRGNLSSMRMENNPLRSSDDPVNSDSHYLDKYDDSLSQGRGFGHPHSGSRMPPRLSPTLTNPYESPAQSMAEVHNDEVDDSSAKQFHLPGLGGFDQPARNPNDSRAVSHDSKYFERSQPPSLQTRGFSGFGGLSGLGGLGSPGPWSTTNPTFGTPTRERGGFPDTFSEQRSRTPGESQTTGLTGLGSSNAYGAIGGSQPQGSIGSVRGSRLGPLFTAGTRDQSRGSETSRLSRERDALTHESDAFEDITSSSASHLFGAMSSQLRDTDSPSRSGRTKLDDMFGLGDRSGFHGQDKLGYSEQASGMQQHPQTSSHGLTQFPQSSNFAPGPVANQRIPSLSSTTSNQLPAAQQKTMVMPDRIRWIYRDPQGNTQGPWSGLEMHDWYRAGFFSPELLVKKVEDPDYEPLAQLIRRIGNSREPFLVPQIGIPGPPTSSSGSWPTQGPVPIAPVVSPTAQPPFAGSFPSFGTTLTADQQNALEQRKQEEQYLMARQKEHLAQQQLLMKQIHVPGPPTAARQQSLQHQQSVHSLNSQPSLGNMTGPGAFQSSPLQGLSNLSYDQSHSAGVIGSGHNMRTDENHTMDERMPIEGEAQSGMSTQRSSSNQQGFGAADLHDQRIGTMIDDRARLAQQQAESETFDGSSDDQAFSDNHRLQQFLQLQQQHDVDRQQQPAGPWESRLDQGAAQSMFEDHGRRQNLSLAEQVQQAASAKQSPRVPAQGGAQNEYLETTPPLPSMSPLPAPAARRNRSHVADALAAESISQSQTPSLETPTAASLAPWAREPSEGQKLPSLKEIQEAEARHAAKQEELAAAIRRAQLEKELATPVAPPPAPGLPLTSTWASNEAPVSATVATASPWAKATAGKPVSAGSTPAAKKTMQQVMQEEEALARKKKAAAAASGSSAGTAAAAVAAAALGKRYADLASKTASAVAPPGPAGAWTTVGATGKVKTPLTTPTAPKSSSSFATSAASAPAQIRPKAVTTASKTSLASAQLNALDEFRKWAIAELRPDLNKDIQVDDFVQNLLSFPADTDLITEAVHMSSRTVDSRHFAEEFVRRRGLAEKGKIVEPSASSGTGGSGSTAGAVEGKGSSGWSEVARKGGNTSAAAATSAKAEASGDAFKIVPAKKKGGRK